MGPQRCSSHYPVFFLSSFYKLAVSFTGLAECQLQHFLRTPEDTEVTEGDTAVLFCQVGNQIGQVQWTKDGLTLGKFLTSFLFVSCLIDLFPEIFQVMTVSYPGLKGKDSIDAYNLQVTNASVHDDAKYECQVGPGRGNPPIRANALTVNCK